MAEEKELIAKLKKMFNTEDFLEWELFISIIYLVKQNDIHEKSKLVDMLCSIKSWFTRDEIAEAFDKLEEVGFLKEKVSI